MTGAGMREAEGPLRLAPGVSPTLATFVIGTHAAAVVAVLATPLGWPMRAALGLLIGVSLGEALWARVWRRAPWSVRAAELGAAGWTLVLGEGRQVRATLTPASFVGRSLVVLSFRRGWRLRHTLVLTPDAVPAHALRRLRARLRLEARGGAWSPAAAGGRGASR